MVSGRDYNKPNERKIDDEFDLYTYLKLRNLDVTEEQCRVEVKLMKRSKYYIKPDALLTEIPFIEIINVWEEANTRYALWSNHKLEISIPGDDRYNFLDKGNLSYDLVFVLWKPNETEDVLIKENIHNIKKVIDSNFLTKELLFKALVLLKQRKSEAESRAPKEILKDITINEEELKIKQGDLNKRKELEQQFNESVFITKDGISVNKNKAEYGGLIIGIGSYLIKNFYDYSGAVFNPTNNEIDFEELYKRICDSFSTRLLDKNINQPYRHIYMDDEKGFRNEWLNKVELSCGAFSVTFERKKIKNKTRFFVDDIFVSRDNLYEALKRALYYESRDSYHEFLMYIQETPIKALELIEQGITCTMYDEDPNDTEGKIVHWDVKKDGSRYIVYTEGKEYVGGGYKKLAAIKEKLNIPSYGRRSDDPLTKWMVYKYLSKIFNKKEALEILELGLKYHEEAERRSKEFLAEIVDENQPKIQKGEMENMKDGWFVQGIKNRYFVSMDGKAYFAEGERIGKYICMYSQSGLHVPKYDKIASLILALINDQRISQNVHTLNANIIGRELNIRGELG